MGVTASVREVDDNRLRLDKEVNSRRSDEGKKTARWKLNKLNSEVAGEIYGFWNMTEIEFVRSTDPLQMRSVLRILK